MNQSSTLEELWSLRTGEQATSYNGTRLLMRKNPNEACRSCRVEIEFKVLGGQSSSTLQGRISERRTSEHRENSRGCQVKNLKCLISYRSPHVKTSLRAGRGTTYKEQIGQFWRACRLRNSWCSHQP